MSVPARSGVVLSRLDLVNHFNVNLNSDFLPPVIPKKTCHDKNFPEGVAMHFHPGSTGSLLSSWRRIPSSSRDVSSAYLAPAGISCCWTERRALSSVKRLTSKAREKIQHRRELKRSSTSS